MVTQEDSEIASGSSPSLRRPLTRSQTGTVVKRRKRDDSADHASPQKRTTAPRKKQKSSSGSQSSSVAPEESPTQTPPITRETSLASSGSGEAAPALEFYDASPTSEDRAECRLPRSRASLPTPIPNLTKKSRGRRVPTQPTVNSDSDQKDQRLYVCTVIGCGKCFHRGEHLKRHIRSIHTHEKRTFGSPFFVHLINSSQLSSAPFRCARNFSTAMITYCNTSRCTGTSRPTRRPRGAGPDLPPQRRWSRPPRRRCITSASARTPPPMSLSPPARPQIRFRARYTTLSPCPTTTRTRRRCPTGCRTRPASSPTWRSRRSAPSCRTRPAPTPAAGGRSTSARPYLPVRPSARSPAHACTSPHGLSMSSHQNNLSLLHE